MNTLTKWLKITSQYSSPDEDKKPTHLMLNGYKLFIKNENNELFLKKYAEALIEKADLYVVECKREIFKLFFDLDFLLSKEKYEEIMSQSFEDNLFTEFIRIINDVIYDFYDKYFDCIITTADIKIVKKLYKNEDNPENVTPKEFIKKGFHLHFPDININKNYALEIRKTCIKKLIKYKSEFENSINDIVDEHVFTSSGLRMTGSKKGHFVSQTREFVDEGRPYELQFTLKNNEINAGDESIEIKSKYVIVATGSKPTSLPFVKVDKERIITSTEALKLKEIPKHLIIIGGGVIGLELGQVYKRLGSEVTVIEYMDRIIPNMDNSLSKELKKVLKKQKFKINTSHKVTSVKRNKNLVLVEAENGKGEPISFEGDYCLVSVGRSPYTEGLNLSNAGIKLTKTGRIMVNESLQTSSDNIFAIGDVIDGQMLAHKAEEEGVFVAEFIAGQKPHIDYNLIPGVVYTWPEVASVGKTEEELKLNGVDYKSGQFPMRALGRSRASMDLDGFVKILADKKTDEILGVHMIGARCADLISEAVVAMEFRASAEDISRISHAHPTFTEAIKEAALAATDNRALHV